MRTQSSPTVAVLGLGTMGGAFARNLIAAGFPTRVWNRTPQKARDVAGTEATVCATPDEAVEAADVVLSVLTTADVTERVVLGDGDAELDPSSPLAHLRPGTVFVQMGTIGVAGTERLSRVFARLRPDVVLLDAPISGSRGPAERGAVTILASGEPGNHRSEVETVFSAISRKTVWLGPVGQGTRMKLVVNVWLVNLMQGAAETAAFGSTLGFGADDIWACLEGGPLAAPYVAGKLGKIGRHDYGTEMALRWGAKDANLALDAYRSARPDGDALPVLERISELWRAGAAAGHADDDISSMYDYLLSRRRTR